jgi:hypothetical protein
MRFSSGAPTTPTTTTSIDLIDGAQGKRGSSSGVMPAPSMPIQVVQVESAVQVEQRQLNGDTPHKEDSPAGSDKPQQSIAVAITSSPYSDGSSQTLPDDDGNV